MANITRILFAKVDVLNQFMEVTVEFGDNASTPIRTRGSRTYTFRAISGTLHCFDDTPGAQLEMPLPAATLKNAIIGGGANSGLIPELNSYFTTNAASIVI